MLYFGKAVAFINLGVPHSERTRHKHAILNHFNSIRSVVYTSGPCNISEEKMSL